MSRPHARMLALVALSFMVLPLPVLAQDASGSPAPQAIDAPSAEDTLELGTQLATQFFTILAEPEAEKSASLEAFLAPEFQIVRANGDRLGREAYLAAPANVEDFTISDVAATQGGDVVVVTYLIETTETIDGVEQTTTAPRLSVFRLVDGVWQLSAHANFGAISV